MMNWSMAYCALSEMSFGCDDQQQLDVVVNLVHVHADALDVEIVLQLGDEVQGWLPCWPICCIIGLEACRRPAAGS